MAFTRFKYDDCRTIKSLQQSTDPGRWILNVPGNMGDRPLYMADPHIRPQKWAGNLYTNAVELESELLGVYRRGNGRDCVNQDEYTRFRVDAHPISYPTCSDFSTAQSRATHPVWWYRDCEQVDWQFPPFNPQENVCLPFQAHLSTRIIERDSFTSKRECVLEESKQHFPASYPMVHSMPVAYAGGPATCAQTNSCTPVSYR